MRWRDVLASAAGMTPSTGWAWPSTVGGRFNVPIKSDSEIELDQLKEANASGQAFLLGAMKILSDERDRYQAALKMIAIPSPDVGCQGCARVAQHALDGHDYRPNVDKLNLDEP